MLSFISAKQAISASVASSGTWERRTSVLPPATAVKVTVVSSCAGQSGIIGLATGFQSASTEEKWCQTSFSGATTSWNTTF